jgi:GNAT superfamily N-acetyltransferase
MDENRYGVREFRDSDYDALAQIQNAVEPDEPMSVESLRHMIESFRGTANPHQLVVEDRRSGELVGSAAVFRMPFDGEPGQLWIVGSVLPNRRREGIGTHLFESVLAEARRRGATRLQCHVRENSADGQVFLAKRGFVERRRIWRSSLEVARADTSPLPSLVRAITSEGVEFTTLAKEGATQPDVLRRVHDLDTVTGRDVPRGGTYNPLPFEQFRQFFLEGENFLPDAWFLAKVGDQYVGVSSGAREPAQPEVLQQNYTGTRPEFRRKKIALALKLMLIDFAKQNDYARIETSNDSLNVPMWTINRALGFRKVRELVQLESDIGGNSAHPNQQVSERRSDRELPGPWL